MTDTHKTILIQTDGEMALLTLNRPESANALNTAMAQEIRTLFSSIYNACRVVIITGAGKHFCAGADLKERKAMDETAWLAQHHAFEAALHAILHCDIPIIAAVNGAAFGGGLELALACDFIYASETARFALTEATLGIMPGLGGTQTLPRAVGSRRARELLFTGKPFSAAEALEWGMVNTLCTPESLLEDAKSCAKNIAANAPLSIRAIKKSVAEGNALPLKEALACELRHYATLLNSKDRHEGINAFNEKRKAKFTGE